MQFIRMVEAEAPQGFETEVEMLPEQALLLLTACRQRAYKNITAGKNPDEFDGLMLDELFAYSELYVQGSDEFLKNIPEVLRYYAEEQNKLPDPVFPGADTFLATEPPEELARYALGLADNFEFGFEVHKSVTRDQYLVGELTGVLQGGSNLEQ